MMYLHLGGDVAVRVDEIVTVCDLDNTSTSHLTRSFLRRAEQEGRVINVAEDLPNSFVVCRGKGEETRVYLSQLNSATLLKRSESAALE